MNDNLIERLSDEADQCRNDGADDIAKLLDEARAAIERQSVPATTGWAAKKDWYSVPVLFNPYTGEPRDARDIQSDPQGILIAAPGAHLLAAAPQPQPVQQEPCPECDGTGTVAGSQAHFPCPLCTPPQAEQPLKPDMFWNSDDADEPHDSIECFLNDQICQHDLEVGAVFTIWQAKKLPSVTIRVTAIDEEECEAEYEAIEKAHGITKGTT
ncbi:MAG: hypothetical protein Q7U52_11590 [Hydrogenophaga sp.]|nr:hypothetical protein [Hydrogenophaga sp.]